MESTYRIRAQNRRPGHRNSAHKQPEQWPYVHPSTFDGTPFTRDYAQEGMRWEPVVEATQSKGDSETHPVLAPHDEFANLSAGTKRMSRHSGQRALDAQIRVHARSTEGGPSLEEEFETNPFQFGMVGNPDAHTSLSTHAENNFWGKWAVDEPAERKIEQEKPETTRFESVHGGASELAAVWAEENTREAIFAAFTETRGLRSDWLSDPGPLLWWV